MSPGSKKDRRHPRVATPQGVWVAWQDGTSQRNISRVTDLNIGGLFIVTPTPLPLGTVVSILLAVPEGEIRSSAVVRNVVPKEGMGIQLSDIALTDSERLQKLITRLLRTAQAEA